MFFHSLKCFLFGLVHLFVISRSVDKTPFQLFHPSLEDMVKAEKVFSPSPSHRIDYYISAERMDHVPALKQPEVSGYRDCKCQGVQDSCVSDWF